jgi:hypothetical protein
VSRTIEIDLHDLLDLIVASEELGTDVLLTTCRDWLGHLTEAEIEEHGEWLLQPEMREHGYTEEDAKNAKERLQEFRARYFRTKKSEQHYEIIGGYTGEVIGCCSESARFEVLEEEPKATFRPVEQEKCTSCHGEEFL